MFKAGPENLILILLLFITMTGLTQKQAQIYQPGNLLFYWGLKNNLQTPSCSHCDSISLDAIGASVQRLDEANYAIFVQRGTRSVKIISKCFVNGQLDSEDTSFVSSLPLPNPSMELLTHNGSYCFNRPLNEKLFENFSSNFIQNWSGFFLMQNENVPYNIFYTITNWKINYEGKEYEGINGEFTKELKERLIVAKSGDKIIFESISFRIGESKIEKTIKISAPFLN
ncbi:MAG: hypothetical protein ACI857_003102 [Arenicella sp.]|jgi:hypothetical protein